MNPTYHQRLSPDAPKRGDSLPPRRLDSVDWSRHPLGPVDDWPRRLQGALQVIQGAQLPMWIGWGPDLYFFCNDACVPLLGHAETPSVGQPCRLAWPELWAVLGVRFERVLHSGEAENESAFSFLCRRSGRDEEVWHRFTLGPLADEGGRPGGVLWVGSDETTRFLQQRRNTLLRSIAEDTTDYVGTATYFEALRGHLGRGGHDLPFAFVYVYSDSGDDAAIACRHGADQATAFAPDRLDCLRDDLPWPVRQVRDTGEPVVLRGLERRFSRLPAGPWNVMPDEAVILPLATSTDAFAAGFIVAGLNPHRRHDPAYRDFLAALASQIATGLARVRRRETERRRVESLIEHERALRTDAENLARALRESSERLSASLAAAGTGTFRWDLQTDTFAFDDSLERMFALPGGTRAPTFAELLQRVHPDDRDRVAAASERVRSEGAAFDLEYRVPLPDGSTRWLDEKGRTFFDVAGVATHMIGACVDITKRKQAENFVWRQKDVLEQIIRGAPLADVLETLTLDIEQVTERKLIAAVMMLDPDGIQLRPVAGRRLPAGWNRTIDGLEVGQAGGSSGAAAARRERVIVRDVMASPLWQLHRLEAIRQGLRACWSTPILSSRGAVLGTLDVYHPEPAAPTEEETRFVDIVTRTAAIAVEREISERALAESRGQLAEHAQRLEERVQERTARLQETVSELESFSYSISHDMRAPLRAMQSFAQILEEECGEAISDEGKDYIRRIIGASHRMDRLIQDVLSYSRVSRTEFHLEPVDVEKLVDGILESYPQFQPPHADIVIERPLPRVLGNEAALTQCLSNLIGNALKFVAPELKPRVRIRAERHDGRIRLNVEDNGIGIDPEAHEKIFRIFYQVDRSYDGTGIGLSIVRKAAERMGARVGLRSEPQRGSTFHLDLAPAP